MIITWTDAVAHTNPVADYQVYRDGAPLGWLGDVNEYDDEGAGPPIVSPGLASATRNRYFRLVKLNLSGASVADGTTHSYVVRAKDSGGYESNDSSADTGYRGGKVESLAYQWQRSAADSDTGYADIKGAASKVFRDRGGPDYPSARYYRCVVSAEGAADADSAAARGWRRDPSLPTVIPASRLIIKNQDGDVLAQVPNAAEVGYEYRINELGTCHYTVPGDSPVREHLIFPNEVWLYSDDELMDTFIIVDVKKQRQNGETIVITGQQVGQYLMRDEIDSYDVRLGDNKKVSTILAELLAFQETERIILGGVSVSLDVAIPLKFTWKKIWEALKLVQQTAGGYLTVELDADDPTVRKLWLRDSLGERKGQQFRAGKNLVSFSHTANYLDYANRLYPVGQSGLLINTKTYTKVDVSKSSDAIYGYLRLKELYAAYKDWTGEGNAVPANVNIYTPTGAWDYPTGNSSSPGWTDPDKSYDADDVTAAYYWNWYPFSWTNPLTLTCPATLCNQVMIPNQAIRIYPGGPFYPAIFKIEIYYGGSWHQIFYGESWDIPLIATFDEQTITGVRVSAYKPYDSGGLVPCYMNYVKLWDKTGWTNLNSKFVQGENEQLLRCAIADYDEDAGYVVSYTHASYLIDTDEITGREDIVSTQIDFETDDIEALLAMGRVKLTELLLPTVNLDVGAIDLSSNEDYLFEELLLGSTVLLVDEDLDIEESAEVVRIEKPDLAQPQNMNIEIAKITKDIIDLI